MIDYPKGTNSNFWPEHPEIDSAWYALRTRSRHEAVVAKLLEKQGAKVFLPMMTTWSRRKDRKKQIVVPMFPGYLFIHTNLEIHTYHKILKCHGVADFLRNKRGPLPANPQEIESLRILVESGHPIAKGDLLKQGDLLEIIQGPFTGVYGRLLEIGDNTKLVVSIELMGQSVRVSLNENIVCKARAV